MGRRWTDGQNVCVGGEKEKVQADGGTDATWREKSYLGRCARGKRERVREKRILLLRGRKQGRKVTSDCVRGTPTPARPLGFTKTRTKRPEVRDYRNCSSSTGGEG